MVHLQLDRMPLSLFSDCDLHTQVSHTHTPHTHTHKDTDRLRQTDSTNMQREDEEAGAKVRTRPSGEPLGHCCWHNMSKNKCNKIDGEGNVHDGFSNL